MLVPHIFHVERIDRADLNRCLVTWEHRMGAYTRPSAAIEAHHALFMHGKPIAVTAGAETVRDTVGDTLLGRFEVVELARLCASSPEWCRVMLRFWREGLFPDIARAHGRQFAISYQDEALHTGNTYRNDGWVKIGKGGAKGADRRSDRQPRSCAIWGWPTTVATVSADRRLARAT
jgi:antitoxin VapB